MRWPVGIKLVEFGLGLGVAAFLGWSILGLAFTLPLLGLGLEPGASSTRLLVAACQDLSLALSMLLAGLLAGAFLLRGRWVVGVTAGLVALAFRVGLLVVTGEPDAFWRDGLQIGVHLGFLVASVLLFAWGFALAGRLALRRRDEKTKP